MSFKKATAGAFVAICMVVTVNFFPNKSLQFQVFLSLALLFTVSIALLAVFDKGPGQRGETWILLVISPIAGAAVSGMFMLLFYIWPVLLLILILFLLWLLFAGMRQSVRVKRKANAGK